MGNPHYLLWKHLQNALSKLPNDFRWLGKMDIRIMMNEKRSSFPRCIRIIDIIYYVIFLKIFFMKCFGNLKKFLVSNSNSSFKGYSSLSHSVTHSPHTSTCACPSLTLNSLALARSQLEVFRPCLIRSIAIRNTQYINVLNVLKTTSLLLLACHRVNAQLITN